jgi:hypothetical protein
MNRTHVYIAVVIGGALILWTLAWDRDRRASSRELDNCKAEARMEIDAFLAAKAAGAKTLKHPMFQDYLDVLAFQRELLKMEGAEGLEACKTWMARARSNG